MEIRAYDKEYIPDAQKCLGDAFDFAVYFGRKDQSSQLISPPVTDK